MTLFSLHLRNLVGNEVDKMLVHMEEEELVGAGCLGVGVDVDVNVHADVDVDAGVDVDVDA